MPSDAAKSPKKQSPQKAKAAAKMKKASKKIQKKTKVVAKQKGKAKVKGKPVQPANEIKFYYFDCYAVGEPIRMALHKAGVKYTDIRMDWNLPRQEFNDLKAQGMFEYGQAPMLEWSDGSKLVQSWAIMNFLGNMYNLKPKDQLLVYRGESIQQRFEKDFQYKYLNYPVWYASAEAKAPFMNNLFQKHVPKYLKELQQTLDQRPDLKFLCGDKVTIYDISVAGYIHNVMLNPKADFAQGWADTMAQHCPERVTTYLQNFRDEFKDYLQNRPESIY